MTATNESSNVGPVEHHVYVNVDLEQLRLTIAVPIIAIKPGDRLIWNFIGIEPEWAPWVRFVNLQQGDTFAGPFPSLTQGATAVWGVCPETQELATFDYHVTLEARTGEAGSSESVTIQSRQAKLVVRPGTRGSAHTIQVTRSGTAGQLDISQLLVTYQAGDTITWEFDEDLLTEGGHLEPRIQFTGLETQNEPPINLHFGPFSSLTIGSHRVRGEGRRGVAGVYRYDAYLIRKGSQELAWASTGDPLIDDIGSPGG